MSEECLICSETIDFEENYSLCCCCGIIICMDCGKNSKSCPFCRYKYDTKKGSKLKRLKQLGVNDFNKSAIYNAIGVCYIFLDRENYLEKAVEYFEKSNTKISRKNLDFLIWLDLMKGDPDIEMNITGLTLNINSLYYLNIEDKIWIAFLVTKELYHARYFYAINYLQYIKGSKKYIEELEKLTREDYIPAIYTLATFYLYEDKSKAMPLFEILVEKGHSEACFKLSY